MIKELDNSLKNLLVGEATPGTELATATISFAVPDQSWRGQGTGLDLNVYLYRILENRELRSSERRVRPASDNTASIELYPARIECSYVLTAWNKAATAIGDERQKQEHRLLSQVLYALVRNPTIPRGYLTPGLAATQEIELPTVSAQPDGSPLAPDFWSALDTYQRPAITCKVTLSLDLKRDSLADLVTTVDLRLDTLERVFVVGGVVRDSSVPPVAIEAAWVRVNEIGRTVDTDADGRFRIDALQTGPYTIVVRAVGYREASRVIQVPQPDGSYDVRLLPL